MSRRIAVLRIDGIRALTGATLLVAFVLSAAPAYAVPVTFNSVSDFSDTTNPNGPWQYRRAFDSDPNSSSTLFGEFGGASNAWFDSSEPAGAQFSLIGQNFMHPNTNTDVLLAFEFLGSFNPGVVAFEMAVVDGNAGGDGQVLSLWLNDTLLDSFSLTAEFDPFAAIQDIAMTTGDTAYIRLNSNGNIFFDTVRVDATFTVDIGPVSVPEPSTIALFGLGFAALFFARRRSNPKKFSK